MGLFGNKNACELCGKKLGGLAFKYELKEGYLCNDCGLKAGYIPLTTISKYKTVEDVKKDIDEYDDYLLYKANLLENFVPARSINNLLLVDEANKLFGIPQGKKKDPKVFEYKNLIDCDYLEDGNSMTGGGLGAAVAGGLLLGGVGALVGGITGNKKTKVNINKMQVVLTLDNMREPSITIDILPGATKKGGFIYNSYFQTVQNLLSAFAIILEDNAKSSDLISDSKGEPVRNDDPTEQLRKYKSLLDDGIITQEEFDSKKKQILGL